MHYKTYIYTVVIILTIITGSEAGADDDARDLPVEELACNRGEQTCPKGTVYYCTRHAFETVGLNGEASGQLAWSRNCDCRKRVPKRGFWPLSDRVKFCFKTVKDWDWHAFASRHSLPVLSVWTWINEALRIPEREPARSDL